MSMLHKQSLRLAGKAATEAMRAIDSPLLHKGLPDDVMKIVNATAPAVAGNIEIITKTFYPRMFKNNPEVMAFFNMSNQRAGRQPHALANSVVASVGHLNNLKAIFPALLLIGHKHCALGVLPEHYKIVHDNFLGATAEVLGDAVTPEVAKAWSAVLMHVAGALIDVEKQIYDIASARAGAWPAREPCEFVVDRVVEETPTVRSVYLRRSDGSPAPEYTPGQYITLCVNPTDEPLFAPRHYTISRPDAGDDNCVRVSVRKLRETSTNPKGLVSDWLHKVAVGTPVMVRPPFGMFTREDQPGKASQEVFLTSGIGITTATAMLPAAVAAGSKVAHVHAGLSPDRHAFQEELGKYDLAMRYHHYDEGDAKKYLKPETVLEKLTEAGFTPKQDTRYYVCGTPAFMKTMIGGLKEHGIDTQFICHEAFGPEVDV